MTTEKRKNSVLTSVGAEKLVVSYLLIRDIECYEAYENQSSYDLIAYQKTTTNERKSATIEVKSRVNKSIKKITSSNFQLKKKQPDESRLKIFPIFINLLFGSSTLSPSSADLACYS